MPQICSVQINPLLTVGVHTCICHSRHEKRPRIKGLSLLLGTGFGGFLRLTPPWTLWARADLNRAALSLTCVLCCVVNAHLHKHTTQRRAAAAAGIGVSVKSLHMNGLSAVCPPAMRIWVYTQLKFPHFTSAIHSADRQDSITAFLVC